MDIGGSVESELRLAPEQGEESQLHLGDDGTTTDLYLVRLWRGKPGDGALGLHGKLQHVVSGASCYFNGLSSLPEALAEMMEQERRSLQLDHYEEVTGES